MKSESLNFLGCTHEAREDVGWETWQDRVGNRGEKLFHVLARAWQAISMRLIHLRASRTNL